MSKVSHEFYVLTLGRIIVEIYLTLLDVWNSGSYSLLYLHLHLEFSHPAP